MSRHPNEQLDAEDMDDSTTTIDTLVCRVAHLACRVKYSCKMFWGSWKSYDYTADYEGRFNSGKWWPSNSVWWKGNLLENVSVETRERKAARRGNGKEPNQ